LRVARWFFLVLALLAASCDIPKDPEVTLDRVTGGDLRVGYALHDPWVEDGAAGPTGIEPELVEVFAETIDAEVVWKEGSEAELVGALEVGELDLIVGGLTSTDPWSGMVAFTHPYVTTQVVVGVPMGTDVPEDIAGIQVAVEEGTAEAGILEKTDADPVRVADVADATGLVVTDNWLLDDMELQDSGVTLEESDHVMAVRMGENDFMTELEGFLLDRVGLIEALLEEQTP
jgi:polar amino acid transport system substrate-binding protein